MTRGVVQRGTTRGVGLAWVLLCVLALAGCAGDSSPLVAPATVAPTSSLAPTGTPTTPLTATSFAALPVASPTRIPDASATTGARPATTSVPLLPPTVMPGVTRSPPLPPTTPSATSLVAPPPTSAPSRTPTALPSSAPPPAPTTTVPPLTAPPTAAPPSAPPIAPPPPAPPTAASALPARTIERGPTVRRMVALTFDAGADRGFAARILDTLRDTEVRATFGMTGRWAEQNPDLVQRMVAEGHLLMNHTYSHASFTGRSPGTKALTPAERRREIERTETILRALTGVEVQPYFRPPYGDIDAALAGQLGQLGYRYNVLWTVDSLGWNGYSAERIVARCMAGTGPGAILLFHVGADSQDAAALPELVRQLREAGYAFGTIAELLR